MQISCVSSKTSPPQDDVRQEIVEVVKYQPINIPDIILTPLDKVVGVSGKLKILTPERLKAMVTTTHSTPMVLWTANEAYIRNLERWFKDMYRYMEERDAQVLYLLQVINTIQTVNDTGVPSDP